MCLFLTVPSILGPEPGSGPHTDRKVETGLGMPELPVGLFQFLSEDTSCASPFTFNATLASWNPEGMPLVTEELLPLIVHLLNHSDFFGKDLFICRPYWF